MSTTRRNEVLSRICDAIMTTRRNDPDDQMQFPTDCFCTDRENWSFEFDEHFLQGLEAAIREYTQNYSNKVRWSDV